MSKTRKEPENDDENNNADQSKTALNFKTKLGRNVYRIVFEKPDLPKTNELFMPHRMAYIVDLTEEESEIPLTSIRSKAECPQNEVADEIFF